MFSDEAIAVLTAPVNLDLLPHIVDGELQGIGVRVRPYGRDYPKDIMVLGAGPNLQEALEECYALAEAGRWEKLSWAARPWPTAADRPALGLGRPR